MSRRRYRNTTHPAQTLTHSNPHTTALSIASIAFTGSNPADFGQTNNCGSSLAAGATCTINVTFTPTGINARSATLAITDNAGNSPQTVSLTGTGINPGATLSPRSRTARPVHRG